MEITHSELTRLALDYANSPNAELIERCKSFSMLHQETLLVLNHLARPSGGTVLEIGPYIGGSTVAIGDGLKEVADPLHVIVELGGAYPDHPHYPTNDILRDLKARIAEYDLRGTHIVEGWSHSPEVLEGVERALGGRKIGLLMIDSDGHLHQNFPLYAPYLAEECFLVLDDFLIPGETNAKQLGVRQWIADASDAGLVETLGVYLWGTWVGKLRS